MRTQFYFITEDETIFNIWASSQEEANEKVKEGLSYLKGAKPYNKKSYASLSINERINLKHNLAFGHITYGKE